MVLTQKSIKMSSEQPVKKKLRRENESDNSDEPDFIAHLPNDAVPTDLQALHLSLPHINENDITQNTVNLHYSENVLFRTNEDKFDSDDKKNNDEGNISPPNEVINSDVPYICNIDNISIKPAPDICLPPKSIDTSGNSGYSSSSSHENLDLYIDSLDDFQKYLIKQCLCEIPDTILKKQFEEQQINDCGGMRTAMLSEWSDKKILQFLSNLQLLFDVYLKQNNNGFICSKIVSICEALICNEYNLIEQIISLCETRNKYINFLAARTLSSFLVIAKTNINNEWLETIVNFFSSENYDFVKIQFALEIVKRVVEWKDVELHVLEEADTESAGPSSQQNDTNTRCVTVPFTDPESYDTSAIKGLIIKSLEAKWPELIHIVQNLLLHNNSVPAQTCVLTFLALWESTISIKANLSVIDTKPFYTHLEIFVGLLNNQLPPIIWKQILSLFNEVLCYGSTLALQDMLPDDTCQLAHLLVRYVKDYRLLDSLPYKRNDGFIVNSFVGPIVSLQAGQSTVDRTLLQKMVLLVLKSVAVTIKETRSDSSDSSIGSDDSDFYQDMQLIERSIRDVLKKVDVFVKNCLDFHPETPFSKIVVHLFSDQDDYMIEAMVCTLDITIGISYRNAVYPDLLNMLNPIHSFIEFLKVISHHSNVLLDYLVSNETCFLLYLLRFLKFTKRNWSKFISSCGEGSTSRSSELDDTMSVLIVLKMKISRLVSRDLFPYNITPILRLLETCENLYEGNEFS